MHTTTKIEKYLLFTIFTQKIIMKITYSFKYMQIFLNMMKRLYFFLVIEIFKYIFQVVEDILKVIKENVK